MAFRRRRCRQSPEVRALGLVDAQFTLTRTDGQQVTEADYRGKWLLVYFGYTFCPDVCPTTLSQISIGDALDKLGPHGDAFQPIFITLDPARDSEKVLTDYLKAFSPRFVGLRGSAVDIADTAQKLSTPTISPQHRQRAIHRGITAHTFTY